MFEGFATSEDLERCALVGGDGSPERPLMGALQFVLYTESDERSALSLSPWMLAEHPNGASSSSGHPDGEIVRILAVDGARTIEVAFRFSGTRVSVGELWLLPE
jgi:hypothetical protein